MMLDVSDLRRHTQIAHSVNILQLWSDGKVIKDLGLPARA